MIHIKDFQLLLKKYVLANAVTSSSIFIIFLLWDVAALKVQFDGSRLLDRQQSPLCCAVCWLKPRRFSFSSITGSKAKDQRCEFCVK